MELFDCTLRDGANVVGNGFSAELTVSMLQGLTTNGISLIEFGNAHGIGAYDTHHSMAPLTDQEYLNLASPYAGKAKLGMFLGAGRANEDHIKAAADSGLYFIRIGHTAGKGEKTLSDIDMVKRNGLKAYYSLMKAYLLTPDELADEAARLEEYGVDAITIMDSAGTMLPHQAADYVSALKTRLQIPVGFHGHNNLGLASANALAAEAAGADMLDCGLMGMARSAGNMPTEAAVAMFQRKDSLMEINLFELLHYIEDELEPAMASYHYYNKLTPLDLILGYSGCHSSNVKTFRQIAEETNVDLYSLITYVSAYDKTTPAPESIRNAALLLTNA